jgi:hypothetical protein
MKPGRAERSWHLCMQCLNLLADHFPTLSCPEIFHSRKIAKKWVILHH